MMNTGCPVHGEKYLSVCFNDLTDKMVKRCTVPHCNFEKEWENRRRCNIPVDNDRRKK